MATPTNQLIRDQNINIHFDGTAIVMNTNNIAKAQTKGKGGARRALGDISNSTMPSALQGSKKTIDDPKAKLSAGGKVIATKPREKKQVSGRKALGDLTNSNKITVQQQVPKKKGRDENLSVVAEGFLHNHQNCIKEQRKALGMSCFLKEVGLSNASSMPLLLTPHAHPPSLRSKLKTPMKEFEMEELPEVEIPWCNTPVCESPVSPKAHLKVEELPSFSLIETPMLHKN